MTEPGRVLHLTGDYPDAVDMDKTRVIQSLLRMTSDDFDHSVISINRASPGLLSLPRALTAKSPEFDGFISRLPFADGESLTYRAPPAGVLHATMLRKLGDWLAHRLESEASSSRPPDLLVAHKLTIEGIAVRQAARKLGIPYGLCLQGGTDQKIMAARRDLNQLWSRIFHDAAVVFPFAPWTLDWVEKRLGKRQGDSLMLPCPTELDEPTPPVAGGEGLLSVFHLKSYRRKNIKGLATALRLLHREGKAITLDIVGGGDEAHVAQARKAAGVAPGLRLCGHVGRDAMRTRMNAAKGFALASHRDSFGLVFVEALFAGLPIVYPKGTAVDGYFDGYDFAIPVDSNDPRSIARGMAMLDEEEVALKQELAEWQMSPHAEQFRRPAIAATFRKGLSEAISSAANGRV